MVEKLEGKKQGQKERPRPHFMEVLMAVMDYESKSGDYTQTKRLIDGQPVILSPELKAFFPNSLKSGAEIRKDLVDLYHLEEPPALKKAA